ncbi:hypothetical protein FEM48_Zijuj02G0043400 [Ziziphus jujuba var. spinosa]|uniref:10 kDa chaperonin, mitochondrial-like n=1 Tax=Ziziphus jujuba var. spinosa TaxID=714518 RepID=A0A978VTL1_ZIZJJ|nr:hypothetical protein FEM48_Zijuj02G0043400 [Ziziphus jujuba var. spinosa]
MAKRLIPLFNRILVEKIVPPSKTNSGIILPEKTTKVSSSFPLSSPPFFFCRTVAKLELMHNWVVLKISNFESFGFCLSFAIGSWLNSGKVVAVGLGARDRDGKLIPLHVKEGDTVLLPEYGGTEVKLNDKEYHLFREDDILGTLHD